MSLIPSASWLTSGTPDYITRQEVIDFASSVVQYISAGGLSSINVNVGPNPSFSTINLNPTGSVNMNGAALTTAASLGLSTNNGFVLGLNAASGGFVPTSINTPAAQQVGGIQINSGFVRSVYQTPGNPTGASQKGWVFNRDGIYGASNDDWTGSGVSGVPGLNWLGSNGNNLWVLQNISTINGVNPNTTGTTFTTLTGTTLNSSNVNTNAVNNISSFNGFPVLPELDTTYNMATVSSLPDNTITVLTTINTPFTIPPDSAVLASINIRIGSFASGSPPVFYGQFGLRVGGQGAGGGIFYPTTVAIPTALTGGTTTFTISGIFQTPTAATTNTIEVIGVNITGTAITCQVSNPISPANIVYAKVLY